MESLRDTLAWNKRKWSGKLHRLRNGRIQQKLIFLHIPKCGGTSLSNALDRCFTPGSADTLNPFASARAAESLDVLLAKHREHILLYMMSQPHYRYLGGHYSWSDAAHEEFCNEWKFITVLRNPVEKWLSQYYFNRFKTSDHFKIDVELEQFLDSEAAASLGCSQVRQLSDVSITDPDAMLDAALLNLKKFDVIGVVEHMGRFEEDFNEVFGSQIKLPHLNKNPGASARNQILADSDMLRRIETLCETDIILYQATLKRLDIAI